MSRRVILATVASVAVLVVAPAAAPAVMPFNSFVFMVMPKPKVPTLK
jgi:hypothetical protein